MGQLESLAETLAWCGLGAAALASLLYVLTIWGTRVVVREAATSAGTVSLTERQPVPALQNNRLLAIHVACMVISYGALTVAFAGTALYLVQTDANRFARLPKARLLETLSYRAVLVGFPLLGLGIALGAYWGNIAWG